MRTNQIIFLGIILFILIVNPLYSQVDIEKATREADRLLREDAEEELREIPEKPTILKPEEALPPIKKEEKFFIKKIDLVGCESFPPEEFSSIVEKYQNKELALADLNTLAKEIEQEYLRRGVISAVFVPPQEIKEQTVILRVVEARMGEFKIEEQRYFKKERLKYYWNIPQGEILRYEKISKSIQMMNKNPDRKVKAALLSGKKPGTTDILVTSETRFPVHFISTFDKEGAVPTGKSRTGLGVRHNNFLGLDDTLLTGYTFGKDFSGIYAYHNLPISPVGTSLVYGYSSSRAVPKKEYAAFGIRSAASSASLSLHQDIYKEDEYLGAIFLGFDAKDKTIEINTGTSNRDRLRIINLGGSFVWRGFGSTTYFSPEFSQGIDAFGASSKENPLASRGARSVFSKFNLGIQSKRTLPLDLQAVLKFKAQIPSTKLFPQEEFSLGGIDSVRGYPAGDYLADNAVFTSGELLIPSFFIPRNWRLPYAKEPIREDATVLVFVDHGWGKRRGALSTEKDSVNLLAVGPGLRVRLFDQAFLRFEWGFPLGNKSITESGNSRFHFSVDFQTN